MDIYKEEQSSIQKNKQHIAKYVYITIIFVLIIFILTILTGFCPFCSKETLQQKNNNIVGGIKDADRGVLVQKEKRFNLSGSLYLTLLPNDKSRVISVYSYNINSTKFKNLLLSKYLNISSKISPDGKQIAFARYKNGVIQIFVTDIATGNSKKISENNIRYKREPIWSPNGNSIAYIAYNGKNGNNSHNPESWKVYVVGVGSNAENERFITNGYNPIFSPNGNSLLVLKNKGLFLYNLTKDAKPIKVWGVLGEKEFGAYIHSHMKLSLSNNGKMLAWSDHHRLPKGGLTLFTISSWKPFSMKIKKQLSGGFIFSVFSPNDKYLAVETYDEGQNSQLINGRVLVYNIDTFDFKNVFNLGGFSVRLLWLTDWR